MCENCREKIEQLERERERENARDAARWLMRWVSHPQGMRTAVGQWPWLRYESDASSDPKTRPATPHAMKIGDGPTVQWRNTWGQKPATDEQKEDN